ncbi:MAG: transposase [Myxococcaceae bacterium]|nr:MAG: transposase [Myxococcaceae bacterium]
MVRELAPDAFWQRMAPLLPVPQPKKKLARPRADDLAALETIVFVLRSGIPRVEFRRLRPGICLSFKSTDIPANQAD